MLGAVPSTPAFAHQLYLRWNFQYRRSFAKSTVHAWHFVGFVNLAIGSCVCDPQLAVYYSGAKATKPLAAHSRQWLCDAVIGFYRTVIEIMKIQI